MNTVYHGSPNLTRVVFLLCSIAVLYQLHFVLSHNIGTQASCFLLLFSVATPGLLLLAPRLAHLPVRIIYLLTLFTMLIAWRLSSLAHIPIVPYIYLAAFGIKFLNFLIIAYNDIRESQHEKNHGTGFDWQLTFVRLFIGLDLIPHFCEKLFAGPVVRMQDVHDFVALGVPDPLMMVLLAGLIEFGGALALGCGLMTRLASVALFVYLMVATLLGHHFSLGFIWASPGGGWEFPVFWSALVLSFAVFGAGRFSVDGFLKDNYRVPTWLKHLMGGAHS